MNNSQRQMSPASITDLFDLRRRLPICKSLDLRLRTLLRKIATCDSSVGCEFGERLDAVRSVAKIQSRLSRNGNEITSVLGKFRAGSGPLNQVQRSGDPGEKRSLIHLSWTFKITTGELRQALSPILPKCLAQSVRPFGAVHMTACPDEARGSGPDQAAKL